MKLRAIVRLEDREGFLLRFDDGRDIEFPGAGVQKLVPADTVIAFGDVDLVRRYAFEIHDHPRRYGARIVRCAEMADADRQRPSLPFEPPRPWRQADGDTDDPAPC